MKQREFPFLSIMPAPVDATRLALSRCTSERDAFVASLKFRAGGMKQAYLAAALGVSGAYISQIKSGVRAIPDWMVAPFCALTGTNLLRQYRALQSALDAQTRIDCANFRTDHIAQLLRSAA